MFHDGKTGVGYDIGDNIVSVCNNILGVWNVTAEFRSCYMCVRCKFGLKRTVSNGRWKVTERTSKISRILWRSSFKAAIFSLSSFAKRRETGFRWLCLTAFFSISATVLRCSVVSQLPEGYIGGLTYVMNRFIASRTDRLRSSRFFPFVPRSRVLQILAQLSPRST